MKIFPRPMPTAWKIVVTALLGASIALLILSATNDTPSWWGTLALLPAIVVNGLYSRLDRYERRAELAVARARESLDEG